MDDNSSSDKNDDPVIINESMHKLEDETKRKIGGPNYFDLDLVGAEYEVP